MFQDNKFQSTNTYSPQGRLFQVEYALSAVKLGSTSIGVRTNDGVLLVSQKRSSSKLMDTTGVYKVYEIDHHCAVAVAGLTADSTKMIDHARVESQHHRFIYDEPMPIESITQSICDLALKFGSNKEGAMSRPFGVSLLVAGVDETGPGLFVTDPSGTYFEYAAKAVGSGMETAQDALDSAYSANMTRAEAEKLAMTTIKQVMIQELGPESVCMAFIEKTVDPESSLNRGKLSRYSSEEIQAIIDSLESILD